MGQGMADESPSFVCLQSRRASMARRRSSCFATRTRISTLSFQTSTCQVRCEQLHPILPGRGLLAGELVVEMVACMLQTWMASDSWSKLGWRWISRSSVGLLSLLLGSFWLLQCCSV